MLPDRKKKLLSGEEIINSKNTSLKDLPSGCKDYAPNKSWLEGKQIQATLETYHSLVSSERVEKKSNLSTAVWLASVGKAKVTKKSGKHWEVFGHSVNSEDWLLPEEVLFLLETSALELYLGDVPLSVEQTYALIIGEHCTLQEYRTYSHLSRKGYRVLRHDKEIIVTSYEKDIHLDQVSLAPKRTVPEAKNVVGSGNAGSAGEKPVGGGGVSVVDSGFVEDEGSHDEGGAVTAQSGTLPSDGNCDEITLSSSDTTPPEDEKTENPSEPAAEGGRTENPPEPAAEGGRTENPPEPAAEDESTENPPEIRNSRTKSAEKRTSQECPQPVPLSKKVGSSPDLMIVENDGDVIEIEDDQEESDVEITDVRTRSMDTVDLMDSDEDDDVVFVCQKSSNNDPSKWRKWFLTVKDFVNSVVADSHPEETKSSKIKLIDLFDLANKSVDSIMRAIPQPSGRDEFINAPDQRFIPSSILPRYSHYRINLNMESRSASRETPIHDSSHTLQEVVSFGMEPNSYSRGGYSFHRTRTFGGFNRFFDSSSQGRTVNQPWLQKFGENGWLGHRGNYNGSNNFGGNFNRNPNTFQGRNLNYNRNFGMNQNRSNDFQHPTQSNPVQNSGGNFGMNQNFHNSAQSNFQNSSGRQNQFGGFQNNQFGNFQNQNNVGSQLKLAMTQAVQMQMLAMSVLQSSQAMMQQCGLPGILGNFGTGNNFPLGNVTSFPNLGSFNQMNNFRGRRPFRRFNRGRRYYNPRNSPTIEPRVTEVTEVVCIDLESEDAKVKPALKRTMALDAIANMNARKKPKVIANIVIDDSRSVKSESPGSTPKRESETVKTESSPVKKNETQPVDRASPSSDMDVVEAVSDRFPDDRSETASPPVSFAVLSPSIVLEDSTESEAVEIVEIPAEPRDTVAQEVPSSVEESTPPDTEHPAEAPDKTGQSEETVSNNDQDPARETSSDVGEGTDAAGSWQTYKAGGSQLPMSDKSFQSLLSYDDEHAGVKDVLQSLQITGPIDETEPLRDEIKVAYDVYLPNQPFKKSLKLVPNYRVIVSSTSCLPSIFELNYLRQTYKDDVPFLHAVVYQDTVAFYQLRTISLPTLAPRKAN